MADTCEFIIDSDEDEVERDEDWECGFEAYSAGDDYCIFHLPESKRERVGEEEFSEEFLDKVSSHGEKEFVGINIPHLDISFEQIEAEDGYPIYFEDAEIGKIESEHCVFKQPLVINNSSVQEIEGTDSYFTSVVQISSSNVHNFNFSDSSFNSRLIVIGSKFESAIDLSDLFFDEIRMRDCIFKSGVSLRGSSGNELYFNSNNVNEDLDMAFLNTDEFHIHESRIANEFNFEQSVIEAVGHFEGSEVGGKADFRYVAIKQDADFRRSTFEGEAIFAHTRLVDAQFGGANFEDTAGFNSATFSNRVRFDFQDEIAELNDLDFRNVVCKGPASFRGVEFIGETQFMNAVFKDRAIFTGSTIENGDFRQSKFKGAANFHDSKFSGDTKFARTVFEDVSILTEIEADHMDFNQARYDSELNLSESYINDYLKFDAVNIQNLRLSNTTIGDYSSFKFCNIKELHSHDMTFHHGSTFYGSKINLLHFEISELPKSLYFDFGNCSIQNGYFSIDDPHKSIIDLTDSLIGSVDIHSGDENPFEYLNINRTDFDGFDFTDFRDELEEINWDIHQDQQGASPSIVIEGDEATPSPAQTPSDLEKTYLKAKNGAIQSGDSTSASEFLIKEMKYKRKRNWKSLQSKEANYKDKLFNCGNILINMFLDITCGFGEKLYRIVGWSIFTIIFGAILYPMIGGIAGNTSSASSIGDVTLIGTFTESLYFSLVTFSTVGYGDVYPDGTWVKLAAGLEALIGGFLIALFVYSLGKQASR